jgi:hypothetical protein
VPRTFTSLSFFLEGKQIRPVSQKSLADGIVQPCATDYLAIILDRLMASNYRTVSAALAYSLRGNNYLLLVSKQPLGVRIPGIQRLESLASPDGIKHLHVADHKLWPKLRVTSTCTNCQVV